MYGLSNSENIFDLRWPLKVKGQDQTPQKNLGTLLFQSTIDIHIQNPHKKVGDPLLAALAAAICSLLLPNCEGSHSVRLLNKLLIRLHKDFNNMLFVSIFHNNYERSMSKTNLC